MKALLFLDYSPLTEHILAEVKKFTHALKYREITVVHVIDERQFYLATGAEMQLNEALEIECGDLEHMCRTYLGDIKFVKKYGVPGAELIYAMEMIEHDMIIAGSHSRHGLERLVGSSMERILRHAVKPVLVVPPKHAQ